MQRPSRSAVSGATLVLGLATSSLTLAAVILGSRLVNIERAARRQDVEGAAVERAGSAGRLAAEPLRGREGLRAVLRALPEAWRADRAPSPTLLAALVTASDAVAQSDAVVTDAGPVRCVGMLAGRALAVTARGVVAREGGWRGQTRVREVARCVIRGERLAAISPGGELEVWSLRDTPARIAGWASGLAEPWSLAISETGSLVAAASRQRDLAVFRADGALRRRMSLPPGTLDALAFSPDGARLASAGGDGLVRLWTVSDPAATEGDRVLSGHSAGVTSLAWQRDGARIVSAGRDRVALVWDPGNGEVTARCEGARGALHAVAMSDEGARVVTVGAEGVARVHDALSGALMLTLPGAVGSLHAVTFGDRGRWLAAAGDDGVARRWATDTGLPLGARTVAAAPIWHLAADVDAPRLVTGADDGRGARWSPEEDAARAVFRGHHDGVSALAVSARGEVYSGADGGDIYRWSPVDGRTLAFLEGHEDRVSALALTRDGATLVSASHDGGARVWSADGRYLHALRGHVGWVTALSLTADGAFAVTGGNDGTVRRWSLATGAAAGVAAGDAASITTVAHTADGRAVLAGDARGRLRRLDATTLAAHGILRAEGPAVRSMALSRNGLGVLVGDAAGAASLIDLASARVLASLGGPRGAVTDLAFSRDGRTVLVADDRGLVDAWNATSLRPVARVPGARLAVRMQLSDDGALLATASDDGAVRLQLSQSGDLLAAWRPFRGAARALRFTPDGWLVAAGEDGTVRVYPAAPLAMLTRACALLGDDVDREAARLCAARVTGPRP